MALSKEQKVGLGVAGVAGLYFLYSRSKKKSQPVQAVSTTGSIANADTQPPVILQPGESVYDPNSEALLNTPPQPVSGGVAYNPNPPVASTAPSTPQATAPSMPNYTINLNYPKATPAKTAHKAAQKKPAKRKVTKR